MMISCPCVAGSPTRFGFSPASWAIGVAKASGARRNGRYVWKCILKRFKNCKFVEIEFFLEDC